MQRVGSATDALLRSGRRAECLLHNAPERGDGLETNRSGVVITRCRRRDRDGVDRVRLSRIRTGHAHNSREESQRADMAAADEIGCDETEHHSQWYWLQWPTLERRRDGRRIDGRRTRHACGKTSRGNIRDRCRCRQRWRRYGGSSYRTLVSYRNLRRLGRPIKGSEFLREMMMPR